MERTGKFVLRAVLLFVFWLLFFDFQRVLFSIHNWSKFDEVSIWEWLGAFVHSFRLDMATAAFLSVLPFVFLCIESIWNKKWAYRTFFVVLFSEMVVCAFIHAGEINAYPEWNHKLTSRVFMHLSNPDEVFRTADYGMTIWFVVYSVLEITFGWRLSKWLFKRREQGLTAKPWLKWTVAGLVIPVFCIISIVLSRGGFQQIPINIDAAYYSDNYTANDLSVNSTYFFAKSFLLYNRAEIDQFIPDISEEEAHKRLDDFFNYPVKHDQLVLNNQRPNIIVVVLESWTAQGVGSISGKESATPNFDKLAEKGLLFTKIYATGGTSEIGNASIFSGYPALPEISISMQPDKHRKLPCLNEDFEQWGYGSAYLFSGDLKYGNIGGYFVDHGFDLVEDENDFPSNLQRGKLNYYDEDLYEELIKRINARPKPFMHCAFTGSTHSPYDHPDKKKYQKWEGAEGDFMNSMLYADQCLKQFLEDCKRQSWYENTLFVFVADHGHASPDVQNPSQTAYFHVPSMLYGEPLKAEYRGKRIDKLGSQADIARTLMYQLGGDFERYIWGKDLLNPNAPEFALHTITRGYGWVTPKGNFTYHMDGKKLFENTFSATDFAIERKRCEALMALIYRNYKEL